MSRYFENAWLRTVLLLCALAAGALLTQAIPTYEEMAALRDRPAAPPAASEATHKQPHAVTGIDVDRRQLKLVGSIA
jgi:hypothetical protein